MGFEEKWKVLADLLAELQERGETVPAEIFEDLRSAKTLIQVLKADPTHVETISRIDTYMRNVESFVIFCAENLGKDVADDWLEKLKEQQITVPETKSGSRFVSGVPRDQNWVRIKISKDIPAEKMKKLAKQSRLSCKMEENGYFVVYGDKKVVKMFVKKLAQDFQGDKNR
ncbi:MAG: DUF2096 domain-containing protein [Candidatus Bathyarchaeota archaeon]|nr:DUF2096 domain-containing protein [Candidatus Bathyarchaeota archaeon]